MMGAQEISNTSGMANARKAGLGAILILAMAALLCLAGCACNSEEPGKKEEESAKEQTVAIPDVVGMTKDDAQRVIKDKGFTYGAVSEEYSDTVALGNVIKQDPKEGSKAKPGATIALVVSKGSNKPAEQVRVPDLNGMTQSQAEEALIALKLTPAPASPVFVADVAPGRIFRQSVAPGTMVDRGSIIGFTVALGNETAVVPNVVGQAKDAAVRTLVDAAFGVDIIEEYNATVAAGQVVSQNPNPSIQVVRGTTVTLVVSKGAVPVGKVEVPDLSTMTLAQAIQLCNSAGLILEPAGDDLNGTVVSQEPVAGTMVEKGTKIKAVFEQVDLEP